MYSLRGDIRFGLRSLVRSPGFTAIAVLCLAVGIGANAAIFSVLESTLYAELPYDDADRLVEITSRFPGADLGDRPVSEPELADIRADVPAIERVVAFVAIDGNVLVSPDARPARIVILAADVGAAQLLGVAPAMGRGFRPDEVQDGKAQVVLLTHELWQRELAGAPDVLGRTVIIDSQPHEVVGVMPRGFRFPLRPDAEIMAPLSLHDHRRQERSARYLQLLARVKSGYSVADAQQQLAGLAGRLRAGHPRAYPAPAGFEFQATPLRDVLYGPVKPAVLMLFGAVALVLLIACANVASLLLARGLARERSIAVRIALGAGRRRLIRLLLTESVLLAAAGAGTGLIAALWCIDLLVALSPEGLSDLRSVHVDGTVLGFATVLAVVTGLVTGLVPALDASRVDVHSALKEERRVTAGRKRQRLRGALVALEIALALVLLVGAGLMMKSLRQRQRADLGFRAERVVTVKLRLPPPTYKNENYLRAFYTRVLADLDQTGVPVAAISQVPLDGRRHTATCDAEGYSGPSPEVDLRAVSPTYFEIMGIPFRCGGTFGGADSVVIDELLATRLWPGQSPEGKQLRLWGEQRWRKVTGVVGHVRQEGVDVSGRPTVYLPLSQEPPWRLTLVSRTSEDPRQFALRVEQQVAAIDPSIPVYDLKTMSERVSDTLAVHRFATLLLGLFAGLALFLALVGIYAVMSSSVTQRTREIGIRMALGAQPRDIVRMLVRRGMRLALFGLVAGTLVAVSISSVMSPLLYGVAGTDPVTYIVVILAVAASAFVASLLAARRATRIDPMVAMRAE